MNNKEKAQALANFWQKVANNDNGFKYRDIKAILDCKQGPNLSDNLSLWIANPPKKNIIDLSKMINSNIDMIFSDNQKEWIISELINIEKEFFTANYDGNWAYCNIRPNHWNVWEGGDCPLPEGLIIQIRHRNDWLSNKFSDYLINDWKKNHQDDDIIAFRVIGLVEGYEY